MVALMHNRSVNTDTLRDEGVPQARVSADGSVAEGGHAWAPPLDGGFTMRP